MTQCSRVLVLTTNEMLAKRFVEIGAALGIQIKVRDKALESVETYPMEFDRIIADPDLALEDTRTVVILGTSKVQKLLDRFSSFIFNCDDTREIAVALHKLEETSVHTAVPTEYCGNDIAFDTRTDLWCYKGHQVYLTKREKQYLVDKVTKPKMPNEDRCVLYRLRKKFGKDFLEGFKCENQ